MNNLGHVRHLDIDRKREQQEKTEKYKVELKKHLLAIDGLLLSDGWKELEKAIRASENAAYERMKNEPSTETAKHFGAFNALKEIREWPSATRLQLVQLMKSMVD